MKKSLIVGIVRLELMLEIYKAYNSNVVITKSFYSEVKWIVLSLVITLIMVQILNIGNRFLLTRELPENTFLGVNLFLEILVFFAFNVFVVFGVKGFFERFSYRFCNALIFLAGLILLAVIVILSYQVLTAN